jgi:hypothetical protein
MATERWDDLKSFHEFYRRAACKRWSFAHAY